MKYRFDVRVGPIAYRIGSDWRAPIETLGQLYRDYPLSEGVADYTVRLEAPRALRRWLRPQVAIAGDFTLPEALPLPLEHGLLAAEMGMNLQLALGERRFLLLHAASVERDGRALILTGESGAGKSTLAALLGEHGWRFMGDEFALLDLAEGRMHQFPRPVSLKNESIALFEAMVVPDRLGPALTHTPKGTIRHLIPPRTALAAIDTTAHPVLIVFPRFGHVEAIRSVAPSEAFVRLTQASTNYVALGEPGFDALTRLIEGRPAVAIDYPDTASALRLVEQLWEAL